MARKPSAYVQFKARMKEPLRAKLEAAAKRSNVTMNAELVRRLEDSFERETAEEILQEIHFLASEQLQAMKEFRQMLRGERGK